ncbi:glycoside hydrolase family protein [Oricola sp.]|uniref:glycoside hydrolase family protein n=1 Tax=Oricola sp. TaxID=1979950 RepID=UPI003BA94B30
MRKPLNSLSENGAKFLRAHEGFVARYYLDPVGIPTIGIGFTWRSDAFRDWWHENKPGVKFGPGARISRAEAEDALRYLCDREYGKAVNDFLGREVEQHIYDGMVSPVFNLGPGSLQWKWAQAVKRGDIAGAAALLRKTGTTAQGRRLPGLVRRRKEEALLLERGIYTGIGSTRHMPVDAMADGVLQRGEAGPAVGALIKDLAALGYYDGVKDEIFGHGTEAAVTEFQRRFGLKADGKAGPKTLASIRDALEVQRTVPTPPPVPPAPAPEFGRQPDDPGIAAPPAAGRKPTGRLGTIGIAVAIIAAIVAMILTGDPSDLVRLIEGSQP